MSSTVRDAAAEIDVSRASIATLWSLRLLLVLCVVIPAVVFGLFAAYRWHAANKTATDHVNRLVGVAHEHALKVLDNNETLLGRVLELVDTDDGAVRAGEAALHEQLRAMAADKEQIQSIWVWGADGRPLAGNRFHPVPADLNVSDREFFRWHRDNQGGLYFTEPLVGKATKDPFFDMSVGRYRDDGMFAGLVSVGLYPAYFRRFHADLVGGEPGALVTMFREDGVVYSRVPAAGEESERFSTEGPLMQQVLASGGVRAFRAESPIDGRTRILSHRKVGRYPIYVAVGIDVAAVHAAWLKEMAMLAALGVLPLAGLLFAAVLAGRRTRQAFDAAQRLHAETAARQRAEQALFQAKKLEAVGRLAGGVAHDFNNALMVVSGNLFILRRLLGDEHERYIDAISRGVDSASKLTKQLLAFSSQNALSPEILRLQDRLPAMEPMLAPVLGSDIKLTINVAADVPPVTADPAELELTLVNLALNARDAIEGQGHLRLCAYTIFQRTQTARQGRWVVIEVQDDGAGIEPKALEHVFDPFFTTKQLGKGTGLGLSQVYAFCQRSNGWAEAESSRGRGTTIRLFLAPAVSSAAQQPTERAGGGAVAASVLLVEDNPSIAAVLEETLQSVGCTVVCQESADDAVAWLDANSPPGVLLTDIVMPGHRDGLDLARHARRRYPHLPVIIMTGYSDRMDELATFDVVVLTKPFAPSALLAAITSLGLATSVT